MTQRYAKVFVIFNDENYLLRITYENNVKNITLYVKNVEEMSGAVFELIYDYTNAIKDHEVSIFHSSRVHRLVDLLYTISGVNRNNTYNMANHVMYNMPNRHNQNDTNVNNIINPRINNRINNRIISHADDLNIILDLPELEPINEDHKEAAEIMISIFEQKDTISDDSIRNLAETIRDLKNQGKIFPPDMSNITRKGMRKIKNFIHNITKVWLNQQELKLFCSIYLQ